jgi:hypothetical protein
MGKPFFRVGGIGDYGAVGISKYGANIFLVVDPINHGYGTIFVG